MHLWNSMLQDMTESRSHTPRHLYTGSEKYLHVVYRMNL